METKPRIILTIKFILIVNFIIFNNLKASTINGVELTNIIEEWLENRGKVANITILNDLKYPRCEKSKLLINDISGNSKLIKVNCFGENPWQFIVRNKVNLKEKKPKKNAAKQEVFALKKSKGKGAVVFEDDLIKIFKRNDTRNIFITDKSEIIGKKLKKNMKQNTALKHINLKEDWLVEKNAIVTLVNNKGFITIKEEGIALNDAKFMEKVKVKNLKSGKVIAGYAKNRKKVIINPKQ